VATEAEALAVLQAQWAYFASDDHIRERAGVWRDVPPEVCLAETHSACAEVDAMLSRLDPDARKRLDDVDAPPSDALALLAILARAAVP
jgi:hypothetical protein